MLHRFHRTWRGRTIAIVAVALISGPVAWRAGAPPGAALIVGAAASCMVAATFTLGILFTLVGPAHERAIRAAVWTRHLWVPHLPWCVTGIWSAVLIPVRHLRVEAPGEGIAEGVWLVAAGTLWVLTGFFSLVTWTDGFLSDRARLALGPGHSCWFGTAAGLAAVAIGVLVAPVWSLIL